jgi:hypothetical protein
MNRRILIAAFAAEGFLLIGLLAMIGTLVAEAMPLV